MKRLGVLFTCLFLSLPLLIVPANLCAQADRGGKKPFFLDNFADPSASAKQWEQTTNGATLLFAKGAVFLKGTGGGYPVIKTCRNPFPTSGDWTASFGYRYASIGHYGTEVSCQGPKGEIIADVHQDVNGQLLQVSGNVSWTKPDTAWHVVSFVMTSSHIAVYLDGKPTGERQTSVRPTSLAVGGGLFSWNSDWNDLEVQFLRVDAGKNVMDMTALRADDLPSSSAMKVSPEPPVFSATFRQPSVIGVQEKDTGVACVLGDTVRLAGTTSGQHRLSRRTLEINDQLFNDIAAQPNEDGYSFDWKPTAPGNYTLAVHFSLQKPYQVLAVRTLAVNVLLKPPLALQQFPKPVPASCPGTVQSVNSTSFHPIRVEFFLNGQSVGVAQQDPFRVTLPISKQTPGAYTVSYQAYDAQGARFVGETETINVPLRVRLTMPSDIKLVPDTETTTFKSDIVPDLKIVRVGLFCGRPEGGIYYGGSL